VFSGGFDADGVICYSSLGRSMAFFESKYILKEYPVSFRVYSTCQDGIQDEIGTR
jgi:hypothetical protein